MKVLLPLCVLLACSPSSTSPCEREMRALREREALRVHGLSENDDPGETILKLQGALKCAQGPDLDEVRVHATLLHARLVARGNPDVLAAVTGKLDGLGLAQDATPVEAAQIAETRLVGYADAVKPAGDVRSQLAVTALDPEHPPSLMKGTRAFVNYAHAKQGCFTLVNHDDLPDGTAIVSLKRAGAVVPLHGDPATFGTSRGKPRIVRMCTDGPLKSGDEVHVSIAGQSVWNQPLTITPDDEIRGALRRNFADADMNALCAQAKEHSAKAACAVFSTRSAP